MMARLHIADCVNDVCPWTGRPVSADALTLYKGRVVGFADKASRDGFLAALVAFETAILPAPIIRTCPTPGQGHDQGPVHSPAVARLIAEACAV